MRSDIAGWTARLSGAAVMALVVAAGCPPKGTRKDEPPSAADVSTSEDTGAALAVPDAAPADVGAPADAGAPVAGDAAAQGVADAGPGDADAASVASGDGAGADAGVAEPEKKPWSRGPRVIVFEPEKGKVRFPHRAHMGDYSCRRCHHQHPSGKAGKEYAPVPCRACHDVDQDLPSNKDVLHKRCKGCHKSEGGGPTGCRSCHRKPKPTP